jgi:hypothetical protein
VTLRLKNATSAPRPAGSVFGNGTTRGCYAANKNEKTPNPADLCPRVSPKQPYECGCQYKKDKPTWVPFSQASRRCNDAPTTYGICRVRKPAKGANYGIGSFKAGPDRCLYNAKASNKKPEACAVFVAKLPAAPFDILCLDPKR